jgi:hypothetical protein
LRLGSDNVGSVGVGTTLPRQASCDERTPK